MDILFIWGGLWSQESTFRYIESFSLTGSALWWLPHRLVRLARLEERPLLRVDWRARVARGTRQRGPRSCHTSERPKRAADWWPHNQHENTLNQIELRGSFVSHLYCDLLLMCHPESLASSCLPGALLPCVLLLSLAVSCLAVPYVRALSRPYVWVCLFVLLVGILLSLPSPSLVPLSLSPRPPDKGMFSCGYECNSATASQHLYHPRVFS